MEANECQELNYLPPAGRDYYNFCKIQNPSWSHQRIMSKVTESYPIRQCKTASEQRTMNSKEYNDYISLSKEKQEDYDYFKKKNPHWGHNQIMTRLDCIKAAEQSIMDSTELNDYISLSKEEQEDYDYFKKKNPQWSHKQIMTRLGFEKVITTTINDGGENIDPTDIPTLREILKKAQEYLRIFSDAVRHTLDSAISKLDDYIKRGASYIGDAISNVIGWLFD